MRGVVGSWGALTAYNVAAHTRWRALRIPGCVPCERRIDKNPQFTNAHHTHYNKLYQNPMPPGCHGAAHVSKAQRGFETSTSALPYALQGATQARRDLLCSVQPCWHWQKSIGSLIHHHTSLDIAKLQQRQKHQAVATQQRQL
jgi:hypothetical protein